MRPVKTMIAIINSMRGGDTFINVSGPMTLTRLEEAFNDDELFTRVIQLPFDSDVNPSHARRKYYRSFIRTDAVAVFPGIIYFALSSTDSDVIIQQEALQVNLDLSGSISFVSRNGFRIGFVIVVNCYRSLSATDTRTVGSLNVMVDGLYRRIQDYQYLYPPIFEHHLQNRCLYRGRKYIMTSYIFTGPVHTILNAVDQADDELIPCVLHGSFTGNLSYRTINICPDNAFTIYRGFVDKFDLSDGPGKLAPARLFRAFAELSSYK